MDIHRLPCFCILPAVLLSLSLAGCQNNFNYIPTRPADSPTPSPTVTISSTPTAVATVPVVRTPSITGTPPAPASPSPTPASDDICYTAVNANGTMTLYKIHRDGSGLTQINTGGQAVFHPSWSPDKSKIVFGAYSTLGNIEAVHADGTGLTILAPGETPAWSPDGTRIAYITGSGQLWVMNADGSNPLEILNNSNDPVGPEDIAWSPDSARLVFNTLSGTKIMNADGTQLQSFPVTMKYIDWSPDGTKFVFAAYTGLVGTTNYWQVFTVNEDGTGLAQLTNTPSSHGGPCWSRDGSRIVFTDILGNGALSTMNPGGSGIIPLNENIYYCYQPCWH